MTFRSNLEWIIRDLADTSPLEAFGWFLVAIALILGWFVHG